MEKKSFESLMKELEGIVNDLESGDIELDKSLSLYKKGVDIIDELNKKLDEAKKQIEVLDKTRKGENGVE